MSPERLQDRHRRWSASLESRVGRDVRQFVAIERHRSGAPHLHALIEGVGSVTIREAVNAWRKQTKGWAHIRRYDRKRSAGRYVTKAVLSDGDVIQVGPWPPSMNSAQRVKALMRKAAKRKTPGLQVSVTYGRPPFPDPAVESQGDGLPIPRAKAAADRESAEAFLRRVLADGSRKAADVIRRARERGIAKRTLDRAKATLAVGSDLVRSNGRDGQFAPGGYWTWSLPAQPSIIRRKAGTRWTAGSLR
jgi:hypothetical protein